MRTPKFLAAVTLGTAIAAAGVALAPALAQTSPATSAAPARPGMTIPLVFDMLTGMGYWNIDKIERDPATFEVRANDKNGERVKVIVDAQSGEILVKRQEGRKRLAADDRRGSADCSERRCRDDLPPRAAAPQTVK